MLDWHKSKEKQYVLQSDLAQVRMKNVCRGYFCGKKFKNTFLKKEEHYENNCLTKLKRLAKKFPQKTLT
jgi:hypothetical protein